MTQLKLDELLQDVAVVGAAGKMGRGIALLLLLEQARMVVQKKGDLRLMLIDPSEEALDGLRIYLKKQVLRYAEKQINSLRVWYADAPGLVSNKEIIDHFLETAMALVHRATTPHASHRARLIFEAVPEDLELKSKVLSELATANDGGALFLTNTSSIPIGELEKATGLKGRLIGFHFYNPPAVQKLLELIPSSSTSSEFEALALELAERLGKSVVRSQDHAGFIGNGHFLREVHEACVLVTELQKTVSWQEAVVIVNRVTEQYLVRPMGIFQLVDYVGIDVVSAIAKVMNRFGDAGIDVGMLDQLLQQGIRGGQNSDGSQKEGIFSYSKMVPVAVLDPKSGDYQVLDKASWSGEVEMRFSSPPKGQLPWKKLGREKDREQLLESYFTDMENSCDQGAQLARRFLEKSAEIVDQLVKTGVAADAKSVENVLTQGFYHLYSPLRFVNKEVSA